MKKVLSIILSICILCSMTACSQSKEPEVKVPVGNVTETIPPESVETTPEENQNDEKNDAEDMIHPDYNVGEVMSQVTEHLNNSDYITINFTQTNNTATDSTVESEGIIVYDNKTGEAWHHYETHNYFAGPGKKVKNAIVDYYVIKSEDGYVSYAIDDVVFADDSSRQAANSKPGRYSDSLSLDMFLHLEHKYIVLKNTETINNKEYLIIQTAPETGPDGGFTMYVDVNTQKLEKAVYTFKYDNDTTTITTFEVKYEGSAIVLPDEYKNNPPSDSSVILTPSDTEFISFFPKSNFEPVGNGGLALNIENLSIQVGDPITKLTNYPFETHTVTSETVGGTTAYNILSDNDWFSYTVYADATQSTENQTVGVLMWDYDQEFMPNHVVGELYMADLKAMFGNKYQSEITSDGYMALCTWDMGDYYVLAAVYEPVVETIFMVDNNMYDYIHTLLIG